MTRELRHRGPVHRHPVVEGRPGVPSTEFWSILSHPEIQQANRDWKTFAATEGPMVEKDLLISQDRTVLTLDRHRLPARAGHTASLTMGQTEEF